MKTFTIQRRDLRAPPGRQRTLVAQGVQLKTGVVIVEFSYREVGIYPSMTEVPMEKTTAAVDEVVWKEGQKDG
jgi:hypothetical protein